MLADHNQHDEHDQYHEYNEYHEYDEYNEYHEHDQYDQYDEYDEYDQYHQYDNHHNNHDFDYHNVYHHDPGSGAPQSGDHRFDCFDCAAAGGIVSHPQCGGRKGAEDPVF